MTYLNTEYHANQITVNTPQWKLTIGDTPVHRKVLMVFLRALQDPVKNKHLFTFK